MSNQQQNGPWNNYGLPTKGEWKDGSGRDMKVGDLICYTVGGSSRAYLKFAIVTDLTEKEGKVYRSAHDPATNKYTSMYVDTVVSKIKVISSHRGNLQRQGSKQTLENLNSMIILRRDQAPPKDLETLETKYGQQANG